MSYQQSGGPPPEGSPGYAQPQDPWAGGFEPGQASVPTDPIPQQYDPYGTYAQGDAWSQQTVPHGGYPGYVPQPPRSNRALAITLTVVIVLLLGAGAGYAAWYVATNNRGGTANPTTPVPNVTTPKAQTTTPPGTTPPAFDPHSIAVGQCLFNGGTADDPEMRVVPCTTPKSYKVIKVEQGTGIPEGPSGKFDRDTTSVAVCKGTGYQSWYAYDDEADDTKDVFFCMTDNP